jgi:hypothetical protein
MPPRKNSAPPPVMTWSKAAPTLVIAGVFDALRAFFEFFFFFGPALAAVACTAAINSKLGISVAGIAGKVTATLCAGAAGILGFLGVGPIETFGLLMADAMGLIGFLALMLWVLMSNSRILKTAATAPFQFVGAFIAGEIPFLGALPFFTVVLWKLYRAQIKSEKAAFKKWEQANAAAQLQERNQQAAQVMQIRTMQQEQQEEFVEQEAANDAEYEEEEQTEKELQAQREQEAVASATQFETISDALSELNGKQNRTADENRKLVRARQIMLSVSIDPNERDPVLRAAYERARQGQKVADGTEATVGGFVFNDLRVLRAPTAVKTQAAAKNDPYRESPEALDKAA